MRSRHADDFNHDDDAPYYDTDVADETQPVRAGYRSVLKWIGDSVAPGSTVLDLGSGTGNTILALPADCHVTAVDVSRHMTDRARAKLRDRSVDYHIQDVLEFVDCSSLEQYDAVVSTYALHHLMPGERRDLFALLHARTKDAVQILVGDLMYKDEPDRARILAKYSKAHPDVAEGFDEEFYWAVDETTRDLSRIGWVTTWKRFSDLSWAVGMEKR